MPGALKAAAEALTDFFYPPACVCCSGSVEHREELLCRSCLEKVAPLGGPGHCPRCGMPVQGTEGACTFCKGLGSGLETALSAAWFLGPVPDLVHLLKYQGMHRLALTMARLMARHPAADSVIGPAEILVPVPLYFWRELRRGYNQSERIAAALAGACGKRLETGALARVRNTRTQTRLSAVQRRSNVAGAFRVARPQAVQGRSVCLIDDVMTTGATASACAAVLKENGAGSVAAYTFARAQ
ncbi:MAG: ComF family protein [Candidatus Glassbacteria bacterium]|nr:ComF family protein [Candidatus Glassbacteria bacterium]